MNEEKRKKTFTHNDDGLWTVKKPVYIQESSCKKYESVKLAKAKTNEWPSALNSVFKRERKRI